MFDNLSGFVFRKQVETSEFILGLFAFFWGIWATWNNFPSVSVVPDYLIGVTYTIVGLLTMIYSTTRKYQLRKSAAVVNMVLWVSMTIFIVFPPTLNQPVPLYLMLAVVAFWNYIRLVFLEYAYNN